MNANRETACSAQHKYNTLVPGSIAKTHVYTVVCIASDVEQGKLYCSLWMFNLHKAHANGGGQRNMFNQHKEHDTIYLRFVFRVYFDSAIHERIKRKLYVRVKPRHRACLCARVRCGACVHLFCPENLSVKKNLFFVRKVTTKRKLCGFFLFKRE